MIAQPSVRTKCVVGVLPLFLLTGVLAAAEFAGGTGTADDPYQIATAEQLCSIGSDPNLLDKHFVLIAEIDLDPNLPGGKVFDRAVIASTADGIDPITDFHGTAFSGVFDGNDHTISNLTIQGGSCLGLFGQISGAVQNVGMTNAKILGTGDSIGALTGANLGVVTRCHSTGVVAGNSLVGGLVGHNDGGRVVLCCNNAAIAAAGDSVGGLVGYHDAGSVAVSYSTGAVSGHRYIGGLVGRDRVAVVSCCYSLGEVTGRMDVGGLVGQNWIGCVTQCYSTGAVNGESTFGGLVGSNVDETGSPGGVIGCFWDIETSGQPASDAGTGVPTVQMQNVSTFLAAGWDFVDETANGTCNYWQISAGEYPTLCCQAGVSPAMPEGEGTAEEPYLIRDANDLGVVWVDPAAHYRLAASVDLAGITWSMAVIPWFEGTFEGNGYVVSNLHIEGNGYLGFFGQSTPDAVISNLGLEAVVVNGTANYVGGLVGCHAGRIDASYCSGTFTAISYVGGLVGENDGEIKASHATAVISGSCDAGGLVGHNRRGRITASCAGGTVDGVASVGGLVGANYHGSINTSSSAATASGFRGHIGGLAGYNSGSIAASRSCGAVHGVDYLGGLVGGNYGDIANCYSRSPVSGHAAIGGLVGYHAGTLVTSCSTGVVTGSSQDAGGLVGICSGAATASFWDTETSGQAGSAAGEGKTTAQMQTASTFLGAGWDFASTWSICEGRDYPRLQWEGIDCNE